MNPTVGAEDFRQEGLLALLKAQKDFDEGRGCSFELFLHMCLKKAMETHAAAMCDVVRVPMTARYKSGWQTRVHVEWLDGARNEEGRPLHEVMGVV